MDTSKISPFFIRNHVKECLDAIGIQILFIGWKNILKVAFQLFGKLDGPLFSPTDNMRSSVLSHHLTLKLFPWFDCNQKEFSVLKKKMLSDDVTKVCFSF